jgi:hypothetical protein
MTAQISDLFRYESDTYDLAGISGGRLFEPQDINLTAYPPNTACWRGYQAIYAILDSRLVLADLKINLREGINPDKSITGPEIHGIIPFQPVEEHGFFNNHYLELNIQLDFSGGLLIVNDFISKLSVHMGFHPAWKFRTVIGLIFEYGEIKRRSDKSEEMAKIRKGKIQAMKQKKTNDPTDDGTLREFIDQAFDRSY